jgi:hypothetical protein
VTGNLKDAASNPGKVAKNAMKNKKVVDSGRDSLFNDYRKLASS